MHKLACDLRQATWGNLQHCDNN